MAHNLFIAYDLVSPGQNYDAVIGAIKSLGAHCHIQLSMFYVHTALTPQSAHDAVRSVMDPNDKLAVIDANSAVITKYNPILINDINTIWYT